MLPNLAGLSLRCPPCTHRPAESIDGTLEDVMTGAECGLCLEPLNADSPTYPWTGPGYWLRQACANDVETHFFHAGCLKRHVTLNRYAVCPICREPLLSSVKNLADARRKRQRTESLDDDDAPPPDDDDNSDDDNSDFSSIDNDDDDVAPLWEDNSNDEVYIPTSPPPGSGGFDVEALTPAQQVAQSYVASVHTWVLSVLTTSATWWNDRDQFRAIFDRYDEQHQLSYTISNLQIVFNHEVSQFDDAVVALVGGEAYTFNDDYESWQYQRWEGLIGRIYEHYVNTSRALDAVRRYNEGASLADRVELTVIDLARYKLKRLLMVALDNDKLPAGYRPFNYVAHHTAALMTSDEDNNLFVLIPAR